MSSSRISDSVGEWFELYNTTAAAIDINIWTVEDLGQDGGVLFNPVVWQDLRSNNSYDIYGAKSSDAGLSFEANQMMNPTQEGDQMNPIKATFLPLW